VKLYNGRVQNIISSVEVKSFAHSIGFAATGIIGHERLNLIPSGSVFDVFTLHSPNSLFPSVRSAIVLGYEIWDPVLNIVVTRFDLTANAPFHQLYAEVVSKKAWEVAHYLESNGYESISTRAICLKKAAVIAGIGAQGKQTVVVSPTSGTRLRFAAVLTSADLEDDQSFTDDICGECTKCIDACPVKALKPYAIDIHRCMVYAGENPDSEKVSAEVREMEKRFIRRPSRNSFIECTICLDVCPIGSIKRI